MLNLSGITVRLGGRTILDGVGAALPLRSRVGLIGRNGAGKTTLVRVVAGELEPDAGSVDMPRGHRLGLVAQEAPAGDGTPLDTVLAADIERTALLAEAETSHDPERLGAIWERLETIDAHTAPARAAKILAGLGFDEDAQGRALDSFSGGWRMRVALAALLFSRPDVLLLDEPSNHLDLEAVMWLENFLQDYPATILIVSHERDFLNRVVDHILHLECGKLTLYPGSYDAFERLRAAAQAQIASARIKQQAERERLKDYIARNSARASTAKQAQSRAKALARMQPIAELVDDPSLSFDFPSSDPLRPPLITLDLAEVGYGGEPVLRRLDLRIDPDDRIALLGRNGNGKTTLARLLAAQLKPSAGGIAASAKMRVGYFTQYQVEELDRSDTPLEHMMRAMKGASPGAVRAQLGRFGFSGPKATTQVGKLSGGERARLALALITRDAPHLLILDEPTNHLDVDAREALIQALNGYEGAVLIVSHDRHMLEMTADRLVLVDGGTAREFDGSIDDYVRFILAGDGTNASGGKAARARKGEARGEAGAPGQRGSAAREQIKQLRARLRDTEAELTRLTAERDAIDRSLAGGHAAAGGGAPNSGAGSGGAERRGPAASGSTARNLRALSPAELLRHRAALDNFVADAEARWLEESAELEELGGAELRAA